MHHFNGRSFPQVVDAETQQRVHEVVFGGDRVEMPDRPDDFLLFGNLLKAKWNRLFPIRMSIGLTLLWFLFMPDVFIPYHHLDPLLPDRRITILYVIHGIWFLIYMHLT